MLPRPSRPFISSGTDRLHEASALKRFDFHCNQFRASAQRAIELERLRDADVQLMYAVGGNEDHAARPGIRGARQVDRYDASRRAVCLEPICVYCWTLATRARSCLRRPHSAACCPRGSSRSRCREMNPAELGPVWCACAGRRPAHYQACQETQEHNDSYRCQSRIRPPTAYDTESGPKRCGQCPEHSKTLTR